MTYNTKHTKVGDIPKDWNLEKLRKNAIVLFSNVDKHVLENEIPVLLCNYQDVYYHDYILSSIPFSAGSAKPSEFHKFKLHKGDVIITKDSEDRRDIAVPAYVIEDIPNLVCGYHLAIIRPNESHLDGVFLSQLLQSHNVNHYFQKLANGVTRFGLTTDSIKNALIPVPPLLEQQKIAEILSTWDLAISTTQSLIDELKHRNKGLAQQLLTGKKRLKGFEKDWKKTSFSEFLIESRIKGNHGAIARKLTVKLYGNGVFPKEERKSGSENTQYYIRKAGQFIYSKLDFLNGAFGLIPEELDGYESTLDLPCFDISHNKIIPDFLLRYVKREEFYQSYSGGAVGGRKARRIQVKEFLSIKVLFPTHKEQQAITTILSEADKELKLHQKQLDTLKEQKKGLMQKLLKGEIRVNV